MPAWKRPTRRSAPREPIMPSDILHRDVRLTTAPAQNPVAAEPHQPAADNCPHCRQPLIDPAGLGWCKACGYCRSLESEKIDKLLAAAPGPTRGAVLAGIAGHLPVWIWVLLAGVG